MLLVLIIHQIWDRKPTILVRFGRAPMLCDAKNLRCVSYFLRFIFLLLRYYQPTLVSKDSFAKFETARCLADQLFNVLWSIRFLYIFPLLLITHFLVTLVQLFASHHFFDFVAVSVVVGLFHLFSPRMYPLFTWSSK